MNWKQTIRSLGPGLLFASTAIGTSHLVLSTRAGAHYGLQFVWVILLIMVVKYPFYEFATRYAGATGKSLLHAYRRQGLWAVVLYLGVLFVSMFAVTAALAALSAGLLVLVLDLAVNMNTAVLLVLGSTALILLLGRYKFLDQTIKVLTVVLVAAVASVLVAVLLKGPAGEVLKFSSPSIAEGAGLALVIGLLGWMPTGLEASVFNSIWTVEKMKSLGNKLTIRQCLFDFHLGYIITTLTALVFLIIGYYTVFGTGDSLAGEGTVFLEKLLAVFSIHLGNWSKLLVATSGLAAIYGTLITAWDAFSRGCSRCLRVIKYQEELDVPEHLQFLSRSYNFLVPLIGLGAYLLFSRFNFGMIAILEVATVISFLVAPVVALLNTRSMLSSQLVPEMRPGRGLMFMAYFGVTFLSGFAIYYLSTL